MVNEITKIVGTFILIVMLVLPATATAVADVCAYPDSDLNDDGSVNVDWGGASIYQSSCNSQSSSSSLLGYNILVTGDPANMYMKYTETRLTALGADVTQVNASDLTSTMLSQYTVVWIALGGTNSVDTAGKSDIIRNYVYEGGGLIVEQPNIVGAPQCLPYEFQIKSTFTEKQVTCIRTIFDSTHCLMEGLENEQTPPAYDTVGTIAPEWTVLVNGGISNPTLSIANYGTGRVIVELGNTNLINHSCYCGVCQDDIMIERMVEWADHGCEHIVPEFGSNAMAMILLLITPFLYLVVSKRGH